jgi:hypothetical protein
LRTNMHAPRLPPGNHKPPLNTAHAATMLSCAPQYTLGNRAKNMSGGGQDDIKNRRVMYKFHEDQTKAWLSGTLLPRLGTSGEPLLVAFSECWRAHRLFVEWMRKMFVYLDSDARREGALMPHDSLTAVGLELFKVILQAVESPPSLHSRKLSMPPVSLVVHPYPGLAP